MRNRFSDTNPPGGGAFPTSPPPESGAPAAARPVTILAIEEFASDILPDQVLLQTPSSVETRTVRLAATLADKRVAIHTAPVDRIPEFRAQLAAGSCLPVGSVEFVRAAMAAVGMREPTYNCYPPELANYLNRQPGRATIAKVLCASRPLFVKPVQVKLFDGFVLHPGGFDRQASIARWERKGWQNPGRAAAQEETEYVQRIQLLRSLPPDTLVWCAEPVSFLSEWRHYFQGGHLIGYARYDDGPEDAPQPEAIDVMAMLADVPRSAVCSVDVGVARDGGAWLVETNDAWALGYFNGPFAPKPRAYVCMLWARWKQMIAAHQKRRVTPAHASSLAA